MNVGQECRMAWRWGRSGWQDEGLGCFYPHLFQGQFSKPTNFQHKTHIGYDKETGKFDTHNLPPEWKKAFAQAGIKPKHLQDDNLRDQLFSLMNNAGATEVEVTPEGGVASGDGSGPSSATVAKAPPPPPPGGRGGPPPPPSKGTPPGMGRGAPPPPGGGPPKLGGPPPPGGGPPKLGGPAPPGGGPPKPKPTATVGGGDLASALASVKLVDGSSRQIPASASGPSQDGEDLHTSLLNVMDNFRNALQGQDDDDDDWSNNEEWSQ
eukprot:TRINITY_DN1476_c0_g2_i8.p1 TRINITY_DN1476_c0_g2~~TRINITY_DN1476_c0_g2_i8.p1  ORF type:complete len:265 (-),score=82.82 TRINITY_DN1476_c0_g2_i8:314-1108(-)